MQVSSHSKLAIAFYVIGAIMLLFKPYSTLVGGGMMFAEGGRHLGLLMTSGFLVSLLEPLVIILIGRLAQQIHDIRLNVIVDEGSK